MALKEDFAATLAVQRDAVDAQVRTSKFFSVSASCVCIITVIEPALSCSSFFELFPLLVWVPRDFVIVFTHCFVFVLILPISLS